MALLAPVRSSFFAYGSEFYEISDEDLSDTNIQYFGYLSLLGRWIIQKRDATTQPATYRFVNGKTDYATAWSAKGSLSYGYYSALSNLTP